jgi:glycolate oxidase FAD binding subunit
MQLVTGEGTIVRAGGHVVKNVAGFDITRLMTGAWGTLGVLTEITVRLRARPEVDETVAVIPRVVPPGAEHGIDAAGLLAQALRAAPVTPLAAELINPTLAARLSLPATGDAVLLIRLGGNGERVASERAALAALGDATTVSTDIWERLRGCESLESGEDMAVLRWAQLAAQFGLTWARAIRACEGCPQALVHGSIMRGIVRVLIPHADPAALAPAVAGAQAPAANGMGGWSPVAERLPARLWGAMGAGAAQGSLAHRVRCAFDPDHILNPGLMNRGWAHA